MAFTSRLNQYVNAFAELASEEDIKVDKKKLKKKLRWYSPIDIERVYDACCRFGIRALLQNI